MLQGELMPPISSPSSMPCALRWFFVPGIVSASQFD
jgi:hypothetical protein